MCPGAHGPMSPWALPHGPFIWGHGPWAQGHFIYGYSGSIISLLVPIIPLCALGDLETW